jgi:flavin-dependent dehydrogenase
VELVSDDGGRAVQRITGVRLRPAADPADGHHEVLEAPTVVAALGRRSAVPRWLAEVGVDLPEHEEDTGLVYLSRFYRLHDGAVPPPTGGPIGGDLGYLKYAIFQGDNRTHSVTFALDTEDAELRSRLVDPDGFDRAATALVVTRPWVDPALTGAITGVHTMGGLINRRVEYLDDQGRPRVLGFHAVGDAHTCTNPLYGRGCSLAMVQATLLAEALADHPGSDREGLEARARAYEQRVEQEVLPWYRAAVNQDRLNREGAVARDQQRRAEAADGSDSLDSPAQQARNEEDGGPEGPDDDQQQAAQEARDFMQSLMRDGLMVAVRTDATVFRAFVRSFNLLDPPELIMNDPDVVNRVLAAYQTRDQRPPEPALGPDRAALLPVLAASD